MIGRVLMMLIGYALACLAAGIAQAWTILKDAEVAAVTTDVATALSGQAGLLAVGSALNIAQFAAPFALVAFGISEWRAIRSWSYYVVVALAIAVLGFIALLVSETGNTTILNERASLAFLVSGFVGGLVYWIVTGRSAGGRAVAPSPQTVRSPAAAAPATKSGQVVSLEKKEEKKSSSGTPAAGKA